MSFENKNEDPLQNLREDGRKISLKYNIENKQKTVILWTFQIMHFVNSILFSCIIGKIIQNHISLLNNFFGELLSLAINFHSSFGAQLSYLLTITQNEIISAV